MLEIVTPNGGEVWVEGDSISVTWLFEAEGQVDSLKVLLVARSTSEEKPDTVHKLVSLYTTDGINWTSSTDECLCLRNDKGSRLSIRNGKILPKLSKGEFTCTLVNEFPAGEHFRIEVAAYGENFAALSDISDSDFMIRKFSEDSTSQD